MKSVKKSFMALLLAMLMLFSIVPVGSADVTADADPGTVKLELSEDGDGYILDVYILNMSEFNRCYLSFSYNRDYVYLSASSRCMKNTPDGDFHCSNITYSSSFISADVEFYRSTDLYLYRYWIEKRSDLILNDFLFTVEVTTYFNETDSVTDSASVTIKKDDFDPDQYPDVQRSGDVNGDKKIDAVDARCALRISVELDRCFATTKKYADVDGDGTVSAADARLLLRASADLESEEVFAYFYTSQQSGSSSYYNNIKEITLTEGESMELSDVIIRQGSGAKWQSSNTKAVKVTKDGKITALKKGFSCIILQCGDEKLYYEVTVKSELQNKIEALKEKYPDGYYWNNNKPSEKYPNVTEIPCRDHSEGKYSKCKGQCAGFAALLFSEVFPNAKKKTGVTWDTVKIGDYVRLKKHHSIFIIDVVKKGDIIGYDYWSGENKVATSDYAVVAHCNWYWSCDISWGHRFDSNYEIDSSLSYTAY